MTRYTEDDIWNVLFDGVGPLEKTYIRSDDVYSTGVLNARVYVSSPMHIPKVRKAINTLIYRPLLLCEIDLNQEMYFDNLALADGIICKKSFECGKSIPKFLKDAENKEDIMFKEDEKNIRISFGNQSINLTDASASQALESIENLPPIVKICGLTTVEAAKEAITAGANMLGMIMVPNRSRSVPHSVAKEISNLVKSHSSQEFHQDKPLTNMSVFEYNSIKLRNSGPYLVGVFRNQPLKDVLELQQKFNLDYVQLHGDEPIEWAKEIPVPVIKRFTPNTPGFEQCLTPNYYSLALIDSPLGGEGKLVDRTILDEYANLGARFIIAGGLNPENVSSVFSTRGVIGVDVSGGVETNGSKDLEKINKFVVNAKSAFN